MNFERGIEPKKSLQVGRKQKAIELSGLEVTPQHQESKLPIITRFLEGKDFRIFLEHLIKGNLYWDGIANLFPHLKENMEQGMSVMVKFRRPSYSDSNNKNIVIGEYSHISLRKLLGKDILYENKIYPVPKKGKDV